MIFESKFSHNNKGYGIGKVYIAKITDYDEKYRFKREFVERNTEYKNASRTIWYEYSWDIKESGIYEYHESNAFKKEHMHFKYDKERDKYEEITIKEVEKIFPKVVIKKIL